ncbi:hypothetical protein BDR22DRAFT_187870 [Usnea florida]
MPPSKNNQQHTTIVTPLAKTEIPNHPKTEGKFPASHPTKHRDNMHGDAARRRVQDSFISGSDIAITPTSSLVAYTAERLGIGIPALHVLPSSRERFPPQLSSFAISESFYQRSSKFYVTDREVDREENFGLNEYSHDGAATTMGRSGSWPQGVSRLFFALISQLGESRSSHQIR